MEKREFKIPELMQTQVVYWGGSLSHIRQALALAESKTQVLLALPGSCLAPELTDTFSLELTDDIADFFPESCRQGGFLKPDEMKKYLEARCQNAGISLLYGVQLLDVLPAEEPGSPVIQAKKGKDKTQDMFQTAGNAGELLLRLAAKSGMYEVRCNALRQEPRQWSQTLSYRVLLGTQKQDGFGVQTVEMDAGEAAGKDTAQLLDVLQQRAMEEFGRRKKQDPSLLLGRFAPCAKGWSGRAQNRESSASCREISFYTGNELTRAGREPLAVLKRTVTARTAHCDVLVAGGGTAGAMAALHAARGGADTVLIEPQYVLGGTATAGGVSTYWFGNRFSDVEEIDRETKKWMEALELPHRAGIWSQQDDFHTGVRAWVLQKLCLEAGVRIYYGQLCFGVLCKEEAFGRRVTGAVTAGDAGTIAFHAKAVIDATGDGDLAVFAGAASEYGTGRDFVSYWASLAQYTAVNTYKNNFSAMVVAADPLDMTRFTVRARQLGDGLFDHGRYVSMRESRHIRTLRRLTLRDLMSFQTYPDALYSCYSNYDPKGKLDADCIYCGFLPPQGKIQIPLSALLPADDSGRQIRQLYVAGKAIGATHNVFPSIRMQPDLMHQGAVLGGLLAACLKKGLLPEQQTEKKLRTMLAGLTDDPLVLPEKRLCLQEAIKRLSPASRTHWVDVPFSYEEQKEAESLVVLLAEKAKVLPLLKARLDAETRPWDWNSEEKVSLKTGTQDGKTEKPEKPENPQNPGKTGKPGTPGADVPVQNPAACPPLRMLLLGYCLWHGCREGAEEYADWLLFCLREDRLPKRSGSTMCAQLLPDHGVMPEMVYRMNLLAQSGHPCALPVYGRVLELLRKTKRDYTDIQSGIYPYLESFAYAAEHGGQKEWEPLLCGLLAFPEFEQAWEPAEKNSLMTERLWILQMNLYRALARLGNAQGIAGLKKMQDCPCAAISLSAKKALAQEVSAGRRTEKIW